MIIAITYNVNIIETDTQDEVGNGQLTKMLVIESSDRFVAALEKSTDQVEMELSLKWSSDHSTHCTVTALVQCYTVLEG